jgi:SAM-dependent methyltransferase
MRWEQKAAIARACARLPLGAALYKVGQKHFGQLRAQPLVRLGAQAEMVSWLTQSGRPVLDKRFLEVGTGHIPVVPIGFYLAGAKETITMDVNRRIDWELTRESLGWMARHEAELAALYGADPAARAVFEERFAVLVQSRNNARKFLDKADIHYLAPTDAAATRLPAGSVDCHYSMTVLEHIPPAILQGILSEAKRMLSPHGVALHFIDPSDHFEHQDRSITSINFLKYSDEEWQRVAGNEFTYCNRLRASDFLKLASEAGLVLIRSEPAVDEAAKRAVQTGFKVDSGFAKYSLDDLCTKTLRVMWQ